MQLQESLNIAKGLGRFEDDHIAHVATGETVVPKGILDANPELRKMLYDQFKELQVNPEEFVVGSPAMKINPVTGQPEFFLKSLTKGLEKFAEKSGLKKLGKKLAPLAPIAAAFIPGGPIISGAVGAAAKGFLGGEKPKDYVADAALGAGLGALAQGATEGFTKEGLSPFVSGPTPSGGPQLKTSVGSRIIEGLKTGGIEGLKDQLIMSDSPLGKFLQTEAGQELAGRLKLQGLGDTLQDATKGILGGNTAAALFGGGTGGGGIMGGGTGGGMGGLGGIATLALVKKLLDQPSKSPEDIVPTGVSAFGYTPEQMQNIPSYRIANLQPALVEGAQYANVKPVTAEEGGLLKGIASIKQNGNIKGYEKGGMDDDGPGDITPAFLEPGEFVMTRPATRALGADNLYRLMKMAESVA
tara:strand:+ start:579 stop:1817 length:1239 start_codon:yes stop_codon:yes gene_type:complete